MGMSAPPAEVLGHLVLVEPPLAVGACMCVSMCARSTERWEVSERADTFSRVSDGGAGRRICRWG